MGTTKEGLQKLAFGNLDHEFLKIQALKLRHFQEDWLMRGLKQYERVA